MHIKTNIEHSSIQLIILAICPLLLAISSVNDAVFFLLGTVTCLLVSQFFIILFNKYLTNDVKSLVTIIVSTMLVTLASILVKSYTDKTLPETAYMMIFSTAILNADFIYFRSKARTKYYFLNILRMLLIFGVEILFYSFVKEFFAYGSICEKQLFDFDGFKFCETLIFELILLATVCASSDYLVRRVDKAIERKNMLYQKYVRIIRSEKAFQYDKLRRERLLANEIEVNRINKSDSEKIMQKIAENEEVTSVKEVVLEEEEISETVEAEDKKQETESDSSESSSPKSKKSHAKKSKKEGKK